MKKTSSKFNKVYIILTIFCVMSFLAYIIYEYKILMQYDEKINTINREIELANKKNAELKNQMEYKNSNENIEKIARDKLGMVKSNEIIFYDEN